MGADQVGVNCRQPEPLRLAESLASVLCHRKSRAASGHSQQFTIESQFMAARNPCQMGRLKSAPMARVESKRFIVSRKRKFQRHKQSFGGLSVWDRWRFAQKRPIIATNCEAFTSALTIAGRGPMVTALALGARDSGFDSPRPDQIVKDRCKRYCSLSNSFSAIRSNRRAASIASPRACSCVAYLPYQSSS